MAASVGQAAAAGAGIVRADVPDGHAVAIKFIQGAGQFVRSLLRRLGGGALVLEAAGVDLYAEFQEVGLGR